MICARTCVVLLVVVVGFAGAFAHQADPWPGLEAGPFRVGYQALDTRDPGRGFGAQVDGFGRARTGSIERPVRISIWYPAEVAEEGQPITYGRYIEHTAQEVFPELADDAARAETATQWKSMATGIGLSEELAERLLGRSLLAVENADPLPGPFPLLLYAPSISSSPAENVVLAEYFASHGFVVASSPSTGVATREMDHNWRGVEAQVRDVEFVLARMKGFPPASDEIIGAYGFSWGGLTVSVLAARNSLIDAVACLDGGVRFGFRGNRWEGFDYYSPERVRAPFLQAYNGGYKPDDEWEFVREIKYADTWLLVFRELEHPQFSSSANLMRLAQLESRETLVPSEDLTIASYRALGLYLRHFFQATLLENSESREFLQRSPGKNMISRRILSVERSSGLPAPPTQEEFLEVLIRDGVEAAASLFRTCRQRDPEVQIFAENRLNLVGYRLLQAGEAEVAVELFRLNVEAYPDSFNVYDSLAEALAEIGEKEQAVAEYRKSLELNPQNDNARKMLRKLGAKERK